MSNTLTNNLKVYLDSLNKLGLEYPGQADMYFWFVYFSLFFK